MTLTLNIKPSAIGVRRIGPEDEPTGYELQLHSPTMAVTVGPFPLDGWGELSALIADPEAAIARSHARSKIVTPETGRVH